MSRIRFDFDMFNESVTGCGKKVISDMCDEILEAARPLVPVETGLLWSSGKKVIDSSGKARVIFSAIAPNGYDYAAIQHEAKEFNHPNGGQDHYLSEPAYRLSQDLGRRFQEMWNKEFASQSSDTSLSGHKKAVFR